MLDSGDVDESELSSQGLVKRWIDHAFMWNERNWTLRQLRTFEGTAGFMLAFLPKAEMWEYNKKMKEETGENAKEIEMVR